MALALLCGCVGDRDECTQHDDCPSPLRCFDGKCERLGGGGGGRIPDPPDAGMSPDGGQVAPDGGGDGGTAGDAGAMDGGLEDGGRPVLEGARGLIWVSELRAGPRSEVDAFAELQSWADAVLDEREESFPDDEGGRCLLRTRRVISGGPAGFDAERIDVVPGPRLETHFSLYPVGNGRFEPRSPVADRLFSEAVTTQALILAGQGPDGLDRSAFAVRAPSIVWEESPEPGAQVTLGAAPLLRWMAGDPNRTLVIEAYDAQRAVVLTCRTPDDGSFRVPQAAASAFVSAGRAAPSRLEIRHDTEQERQLQVGGRGTFPVTFRASWGNRFTLRD